MSFKAVSAYVQTTQQGILEMRIGFPGYMLLAFALIMPGAMTAQAEEGFRLSTNKEVREIMPEPPVKVKLKKLANGKYAWEITGANVDKVLEADRKLRKYMKENGLKAKK